MKTNLTVSKAPQPKNKFLVNFAKSLFILKKHQISEIACKLGIPSSNLMAFIEGKKMAIAPEHAVKLFYFLGIGKNSKKEIGFQSNCVHAFELNIDKNRNIAGPVIQTALKILPQYQAREVYHTRRQIFILIAFEDIRIVLKLSKGFFNNLETHLLRLKNFKNLANRQERIPNNYLTALKTGTLGVLDFDALFFYKFDNWQRLQSIANVHGVPFVKIMRYIKQEARNTQRYTIVDFQKAIQSDSQALLPPEP